MAKPPSPKLVSPISTATATTTVSPTKRPQPIPWTHQETVNLIKAYQEKWYSLKRGQLRANQWEEVAVVVAARCGYDFNHPSKSAVQCRHKMEKLRQRHRAEKNRLAASAGGGGGPRCWQYFGLMGELERGPLPISARPLVSFMPFDYEKDDDDDDNDDDENEDDEEDEDDDDDDDEKNYIKSRSINYILSQRPTTKYGGVSGFSREHVARGMWRVSEDDDDDDEEEEEEEKGVVVNEMGLVLGLTAEIKGFAERFIGVENLKMEMMKETERCRLEMENKRNEMILESQRRIVDSIGRAFGSSKRMKMSQEI